MSFRSIQAQKLIDRTVNQPQYNYVLLQSEVSNNYDKNAFKVLAFDIFFNAKVEALKKVLEKGSIYEVEKQVQDLNQEKLCHVGYVNKDAARLLMNLLTVNNDSDVKKRLEGKQTYLLAKVEQITSSTKNYYDNSSSVKNSLYEFCVIGEVKAHNIIGNIVHEIAKSKSKYNPKNIEKPSTNKIATKDAKEILTFLTNAHGVAKKYGYVDFTSGEMDELTSLIKNVGVIDDDDYYYDDECDNGD